MACLRRKTTRVWLDGTRKAERDLGKTNGLSVHKRYVFRTMRMVKGGIDMTQMQRQRQRESQVIISTRMRKGGVGTIQIERKDSILSVMSVERLF